MEKRKIYVFVALLSVITCCFLPLNYNVNDDVELESILSGMYTGSPDGHAIYIQAILSWPLAWLYRLLPGWNWYGIFLCGIQWLALALVMDRAADCMKDPLNRLLAMGNILLIFFVVVWENYVSITFTTASGILLAAVLYWYIAGDDSLHTQLVTALLVLVGISLRIEFAPVILLTGAVCWLLKVYRSGFRKVWILPAALGAGFFCMVLCQSLAYGSEGWRNFLSFSDARSQVYDYTGVPSYEADREFYDQEGIPVQVFEALDIYDLTGRPEVTEELLLKVASHQQEQHRTSFRANMAAAFRDSLVSFFEDQYGRTLSPVNILMCVVWIGLLASAVWKRRYSCLLAGDSVILAVAAMWFYLSWEGRLLYRVLFVMQLLMVAVGAGLWQLEGRNLIRNIRVRRYLLSAALFLLLVPAVKTWPACRAHAMEAKEQNEDRNVLEAYFEEHPDQFYFLTTPLVAPISDEVTLRVNPHPANYAELGGWIVRSPLYEEKLAHYGITDIRQTLLEQKGCVVTSGRKMDYLFSDTYEEGTDIEYRCVDELHGEDWKYYIYQYILL